MSAAACPICRTPCSAADRWCAACGAPLVQLRWRGAEGDWREQGGRLAVRRGAASTVLAFQNQGPVPAGLVLLGEGLTRLPAWVLREQLEERAILIPPGGQVEIEVPFVQRQLEAIFRASSERGGLKPREVEARLALLTTLCRAGEGGWTSRTLDISLQVAREPWIEPAGSVYRFLPLEIVGGEGFVHALVLRNEHAEPIEILELGVADTPAVLAPPAAIAGTPLRLAAARIARLRAEDVPQALKPGSACRLGLRLQVADADLPEGSVGWFSLQVRCRYRHQVPGQITALLEGVVGRAPRLLALDSPKVDHPSLDAAASFGLRVANPGDLPLRITRVEVLRPDGSPAPAGQPDWFRLHDPASDDTLDPGEARALLYDLRPEDRPAEELGHEWCSRRVRLHHDGWGPEDKRVLELTIGAQLGAVRIPTGVHLGIDFGTSNSMVCLVRGDGSVQVALPLEGGLRARDQLPSLMFFRGGQPDDALAEPFLYGHEADASAGIEPTNLVRSIKSVVAKDPGAHYHFLEEVEPGRYQRRSFRPQELLDLFIAELRRRAERAVSNLPVRDLHSLNLTAGKVRFTQAIFSHPVEVGPEMKRALMDAAHAAGLNREQRTIEAFAAEGCVDEATAAALSFVYARMSPGAAEPRGDFERVLGVDMGGGTTDVAAVEIRDLAAYKAGTADNITMDLMAVGGDSDFGGDDLDALLAGWVLESILEQSTAQGAPIDLPEIEKAVGFRSFAEYFSGFKTRRGRRAEGEDEALHAQARAVFGRAMEVLRRAEEAKCALTFAPAFELNFSGEGWPRRGRPREAGNFKIEVQRARFDAAVRDLARRQCGLLERVRHNAGWAWADVTTMLFTGQGTRVPVIREELLGFVAAQRGPGAPPLAVVQPDDGSGFDPKRCVAMGAALWGMRQDSGWVVVRNRLAEELTFDLQRPHGPFRFLTVPGLERGRPLPAEASVAFQGSRSSLELYKDRRIHVVFRFPAATEVRVRVEGPGQYLLTAGETVVRGEVLT